MPTPGEKNGRDWKRTALMLAMVLMFAYLIRLELRIQALDARLAHVGSTLGGIEGIVSATDYTLEEVKAQMTRLEGALKARQASTAKRN